MKEAFKGPWIEALRSGHYQQGQEYLKQKGDDGTAFYCCLGVLCEVSGAVVEWDDDSGYHVADLGNDVHRWADEEFDHPMLNFFGISQAEQSALVNLNDTEGADFESIADYIEAEL